MPYNLKGKNVLITGGSRGLGAAIAQQFAAEGSNVAINYANNEAPAAALSEKLRNEYGVKTIVIKADCGVTSECQALVRETVQAFGGVDVVIGNAGWTKVSQFDDLNALSEEEWDKCWKVNVWGQMAIFREALPWFNANAEGGVFIFTSSVAGSAIGGSAMAYSVTKAAQIHLMKCLAQTQGPKVRISAVRPGLLLTDWGLQFSPEKIKRSQERAALKSDTNIDECASTYVMIAKNTAMTGQSIGVDAGLNIAAVV